MRRLALVLIAALAFAACGDDGGGSEDAARFCDIDRQIEDLAEPTTEEEGEEFVSEFKELVAEGATVAPDEISDDVDALNDAVADITFDDLVTLDSSEEFNDAIASIGAWTEENCTDE
jgi:hypothetical protein